MLKFKIVLIVLAISSSTIYARDKNSRETSPLKDVKLQIGMPREKVEKLVAKLLVKNNNYSPYGNNLKGGKVNYRDGFWILEVIYNPGTPAPWVINKQGIAEHYPPVDETVKFYRIYRK